MKRVIRRKNKPFVLYVVLISLVAVYLRLLKLSEQGIFLDEALSWLRSQFPWSDLVIILRYLNHVPLYFILLKLYLYLAPQTEFGLRSLSVIFSLLSLLVTIFIVYRWWGIRASIFTGWLITISSFDIYYAQDVRMYSMLSFLWLVSYGLLLEILNGRYKFLPLWGINLVLISQTHIYGLILAFVQSTLIMILWISGFYLRKKSYSTLSSGQQSDWTWRGMSMNISASSIWVLGTGVIVFFGVIPNVWILLNSTAWRSLGGGVWIPTLRDLPNLFLLASVGLTAGRNYFLDTAHLVLPMFSTISSWGWMLVGLLLLGSLVIRGCYESLRNGTKEHWLINITLLSSLGPIVIVWLIGWVLKTNTWAYKSFLGSVTLVYVLAGIGFSKIKITWIRWMIVGITLLISLASLIPYYTIWTKDSSGVAFRSLPNTDQGGIVLMERAYMSPLAHFYLGKDEPVIALNNPNDLEYPLLNAEFGPKFMYGFDKLACDENKFIGVNNVWIYGSAQVVKDHLITFPNCFGDAQLWIFDVGEWNSFDL